MCAEYVEPIRYEDEFYAEPLEQPSGVQLPPAVDILLLGIWAVICLGGFVIIFVVKNLFLGIIIIGVPTFLGMVMKPTFALCMLMLILPTGAGVGIPEVFSLDRGIGIAVAAAFALNLLFSRPRLRIGNKALWILTAYTIWVVLASLATTHLALEIRVAFTTFQLLALVFIVYWILETNPRKTFVWALRSYVVGSLATIALAYITGAEKRVMKEAAGRYAATAGWTIGPNMLAVLIGLAFLTAIYLFARDKHILFRIIYLIAIVLLPVMILRTGSRGGLIALAFTLMSPLLFLKQVCRKPALIVLLLVGIIFASGAATFLVRRRGLEEKVSERLTEAGLIRESFGYRLELVKKACEAASRWPTGTTRYGWFERVEAIHYPHSDFFYALGVYGIPGAALFVLFMLMMMLTVKHIPLGLEKLYARAVLTFLFVAGFGIGQLAQKHFWAFLAIVMAAERISQLNSDVTDYTDGETDEETAYIDY